MVKYKFLSTICFRYSVHVYVRITIYVLVKCPFVRIIWSHHMILMNMCARYKIQDTKWRMTICHLAKILYYLCENRGGELEYIYIESIDRNSIF